MSIPVVDFGAYSLNEKDVTDEQIQILSDQLKTAFTEIGFVFLKNTGITEEEVNRVMEISKEFFLQKDELKQPFSRGSYANSPNHGWVSLETERLNPRRPGDLKESFNITSLRSDILSRWCPANDVGFVDYWQTFWGRPDLIQRDGIHPTWEGAALISRNLARFISGSNPSQPRVETKRQSPSLTHFSALLFQQLLTQNPTQRRSTLL